MSEFLYELKRAVKSRNFVISLIIGIFICFLDILIFRITFKEDSDRILIQAWIGTNYAFAFNSVFYSLMPLIACIPYGASYFSDMRTGYDKNILTRTSRRKYMAAKVSVSFFMGFLAVCIPLLIDLFISAGFYPNLTPEKLTFLSAGIIDRDMFPVLFNSRPLLYILIFIFIDGMFGGLFNIISIAVSKFSGSSFTATVVPFVLYILTGVMMQNFESINLSILELVNPVQRYSADIKLICCLYSGILIVCLGIIMRQGRKRDVI